MRDRKGTKSGRQRIRIPCHKPQKRHFEWGGFRIFKFLLLKPPKSHNLNPPRASTNGADNGSIEPSKPTRGRKKGTPSSSSEAPKKPRRSKKSEVVNGAVEPQPENPNSELEDYDDGIDFPYDYPPLVCCFGAAQNEFVPTVRVSDNRMHPDIYSQWKMLQWDPPDAPG
ncbi:hypothetical protein DVH24_016385 [Malus domestica]|uniref:Uncharacterized protein n=1 Tax=Malus domestica TaxID=3750 RepID=A0A498HXE6_MALDO|nr:hypothetical protein DVH24_016385 [Malus domestica]